MAHPKKLGLDFTFILKLSKEDREKLNALQISGLNMSQYFREKIREVYEMTEQAKIIHKKR